MLLCSYLSFLNKLLLVLPHLIRRAALAFQVKAKFCGQRLNLSCLDAGGIGLQPSLGPGPQEPQPIAAPLPEGEAYH